MSLNTIKTYLNCNTNFNFNNEFTEIEGILKKSEPIKPDLKSEKIITPRGLQKVDIIKCPCCGREYSALDFENFCTRCGQRFDLKGVVKC